MLSSESPKKRIYKTKKTTFKVSKKLIIDEIIFSKLLFSYKTSKEK